jgi:hypothetical protein
VYHRSWIFEGDNGDPNFVQPPDRCKAEYPELWAEIERTLPHLSEADRCKVCALVVGTCPHCHAADAGCPCWNDE